jgi:hypothetical protein
MIFPRAMMMVLASLLAGRLCNGSIGGCLNVIGDWYTRSMPCN